MGTATFQFIKTLYQTVSVVIGQLILQNRIQNKISILHGAGIPDDLLSALRGGYAVSSASAIHALGPKRKTIVKDIIAAATDNMWRFYTVLAATSVIISFRIAASLELSS